MSLAVEYLNSSAGRLSSSRASTPLDGLDAFGTLEPGMLEDSRESGMEDGADGIEEGCEGIKRQSYSAGSQHANPFGDSIFDHGDTALPTDEDSQDTNAAGFDFGEDLLFGDAARSSTTRTSPLDTFASSLGDPPSYFARTEGVGLDQDSQDDLPDLDALFSHTSTTRPGPSKNVPPIPTAESLESTIRARTFSGELVFFPRRKKRTTDRSNLYLKNKDAMNQLLSVPIHRLMDSLSSTTAARIQNEEQNPIAEAQGTDSIQSIRRDLWVDRYRPKSYMDLLGDERVHRDTLAWVTEWDRCVFKKGAVGRNKYNKRTRTQMNDDRPPDEYGRPHEKILLLAGPPGLGKTTLAHVVAAKAGYSVLEINASDARTGNIIDDRVRPALESGQGLRSNKPVLVVIDEVDGATGENAGSFIQKLVQLTLDRPKKKPRPGQKRDPQDKRPLLRPIICICNDLWASSIARLRPICRIIRFNPAAPVQLAKRLRDICDNEGLPADSRALTQLVAVSKGDMRGCINTLQMIHKRCAHVTESIVRTATTGMKDSEASAQAVWNDIFIPMSKKRVKDLAMTEAEHGRYVERLSRLIDASGTAEKIALGCFEHYPTLHRHDPSFKRLETAHTWLGVFDRFQSAIRTDQEYALMGYLSYFVVPFHPLYADPGNSKPERPKADWECYGKTKTTEEIYKTMARAACSDHGRQSPGYRHLLAHNVLVTEFAPLLNRIVSPPLRPVNREIIRFEERAVLDKLVDIMVSLELHFVQEKDEDGQLTYRLDPPIDIAVTYEGKRAADIAVPRYAVRHMVAVAMEAKYAARRADAIETNRTRKVASFFGRLRKPVAEEPEDVPHPVEGEEGVLTAIRADGQDASPAKRMRTDDKKLIDIADRPPTDFFGRPLAVVDTSLTSTSGPPKPPFSIQFRFHEGSSAAVRRPVKIWSLR